MAPQHDRETTSIQALSLYERLGGAYGLATVVTYCSTAWRSIQC